MDARPSPHRKIFDLATDIASDRLGDRLEGISLTESTDFEGQDALRLGLKLNRAKGRLSGREIADLWLDLTLAVKDAGEPRYLIIEHIYEAELADVEDER